ncbi:hypothetical protein M8J76_010239 [Diaphorina citri]|nr:hypothetical protein M8J76_010239 [Diaphorina citri]
MAMLLNNDILVLEALKYLSGPSGAPVGEHQVLGLVNFKAAVTLSAGDIRQSLASLHKLGMIDVFVPLTQACCGDACVLPLTFFFALQRLAQPPPPTPKSIVKGFRFESDTRPEVRNVKFENSKCHQDTFS